MYYIVKSCGTIIGIQLQKYINRLDRSNLKTKAEKQIWEISWEKADIIFKQI